MSTLSFYPAFSSSDDLHAAMITEIVREDHDRTRDRSTDDGLAAAQGLVAADPSDAAAVISALAAVNLEHHLGPGRDAVTRMLWLLGTVGHDEASPVAEATRNAYREAYDEVQERRIVQYEAILAAWGRKPRDPFDVRSISVLITALADGLLVRDRFDPATDALTLYQDAVTGLLAVFTARADEPDDRDLFETLGAEFAQRRNG